MPAKKYRVELTSEKREYLLERIGRGERPARELTRARILLKMDEGPDGPAWTDKRTADALEVAEGTVQSLRERFCERGSEGTVERKSPDREYDHKLDGEQEAEFDSASLFGSIGGTFGVEPALAGGPIGRTWSCRVDQP